MRKRRKHDNTKFQKARNHRKRLDIFFVFSAPFRVFVFRIFRPQLTYSLLSEATAMQAVEPSLSCFRGEKGAGSQFEAAGANAELTFGGNDSIIRIRLHHDEFKLLAEPIS
jgi:hypothetical protein